MKEIIKYGVKSIEFGNQWETFCLPLAFLKNGCHNRRAIFGLSKLVGNLKGCTQIVQRRPIVSSTLLNCLFCYIFLLSLYMFTSSKQDSRMSRNCPFRLIHSFINHMACNHIDQIYKFVISSLYMLFARFHCLRESLNVEPKYVCIVAHRLLDAVSIVRP